MSFCLGIPQNKLLLIYLYINKLLFIYLYIKVALVVWSESKGNYSGV